VDHKEVRSSKMDTYSSSHTEELRRNVEARGVAIAKARMVSIRNDDQLAFEDKARREVVASQSDIDWGRSGSKIGSIVLRWIQ